MTVEIQAPEKRRIYDMDHIRAGERYTLLLKAHTARQYEFLQAYMYDLGIILYGLAPEEASKLTKAQIEAFRAHNLAEDTKTPEEDRDKYWKQAEKNMAEYFRIIKDYLLKAHGICINPLELAANEIAWWKLHNAKDYDGVTGLLAARCQMLYKLDAQQSRNVANTEVKAMEYYDRAKKGNDRRLWEEVLSQNILACYALKEELMKKYR